MRYFILVSFLLLVTVVTKAQVFGGNPPSLKFNQLNTDSVRVIFPKGLEKEAREVAWTAHELYKNNPASLGNKLRKFNIVLQNQTIQSNAYVGIAPYRSEYYMMPGLNNVSDGSIPWHLSLAVHEHRHMEQMSNFNRTIPKILNVFLGQQGTALGFGAVVPNWFFEGDAVWQETMVTKQGRGRLPDFFNAYRSLWQANKDYSYMKLRNGSFKHFVPNHYDIGYFLVGYGREKYGNDLWKKVTEDAVDYKGVFYPFQHAIKKHTGLKYKNFVNDAFAFYKEQMNLKPSDVFGTMQPVTPIVKNNVVNYQYPFKLEDGSLLTLKSSYRQIPVWVRIDENRKERVLRVKDVANESYYSFKNNTLVYTAFEPHPRWGWNEYSVVKAWDLKTDQLIKVSSRSRLFMPDVNAAGNQIIAMQYSTDMISNLVLMNIETDAAQQKLPNPNNYLYTYPRFTATNTIISAVRNRFGEMSLVETDLTKQSETILIPFGNTTISFVQVSGDSILFTASQKEGDVLFLLNKKNKELFKIAQLPNGNNQSFLDEKTGIIYFNTFTVDGIRLVKQKISGLSFQKVETLESLPNLYLATKTFTTSPDLIRNVQQLPGEIKKYKQGFKLLNIHSWQPTIAEPDYGITILSENVLNTFTGEYGYTYNRNEGFHRASATMVYGGFFPQLRAGVQQTWERRELDENNRLLTWNQTNANAGISIPLNLTSGRTFKFLTFNSSFNTEQLFYTGPSRLIKQTETFNYLSNSLVFIHQSQRAYQQIFPRWAQTFRIQYRRTVNGELGNQFFANMGLYFPGLFHNHHLVLFGSVQSRDTLRGGKFTNSFPFARGYNAVNFPRVFRLSANYHFPVVYPDFGFGNIVYLLRIRANAFYDYTRGRSLRTGRLFPLSTAGCEVYFDTKIWNLFDASFGIRYSRLLNNDLAQPGLNPNQFEIVLPVDLF
ncbi:MAG: hypothetical protein ACK5DG_00170 [Chitinophagaceae bacterium]